MLKAKSTFTLIGVICLIIGISLLGVVAYAQVTQKPLDIATNNITISPSNIAVNQYQQVTFSIVGLPAVDGVTIVGYTYTWSVNAVPQDTGSGTPQFTYQFTQVQTYTVSCEVDVQTFREDYPSGIYTLYPSTSVSVNPVTTPAPTLTTFQYLTIRIQGDGSTNPAPNTYTYAVDQKVTLTAQQTNSNSPFQYWLFDDHSTSINPTVTVTLTYSKTALAVFGSNTPGPSPTPIPNPNPTTTPSPTITPTTTPSSTPHFTISPTSTPILPGDNYHKILYTALGSLLLIAGTVFLALSRKL